MGYGLFDPNAFDVLAKPDDTPKGKGVHKVSREDLLQTLRVHQVMRNAEAKPHRPPISELERLERAQRLRNEALLAKRPVSELTDARGALVGGNPPATYLPLPPADADSKTLTYPYVAAAVLVYQLRPDGGWNLALWRSVVTGHWTAVHATFAARHNVSASRANALRHSAAEALCEQSCGLLRVAPGAVAQVLRDAASVSVVFDGGPWLDADAHPRDLVQIFGVVVNGVDAHDLAANRAAVERNLSSARPSGGGGAWSAAAHQWLEKDDLAWVPLEAFGQPRGRASVTDTLGRVCDCRKLMDLLGRPLAPSPLTPALDSAGGGGSGGGVLAELTAKVARELADISQAQPAGGASAGKEGARPRPNPAGSGAVQLFFESKWFGGSGLAPASPESAPDGTSAVAQESMLTRHSELQGGLLAGASTAALASIATSVTRSVLW